MEDNTAIQPDADEDYQQEHEITAEAVEVVKEKTPVREPVIDPRVEALNRIAARNYLAEHPEADPETFDADSAHASQHTTTIDPEAAENLKNKPDAAHTPPAATPNVDLSTLVPVTIDGETQMVPMDTVLKGYQIESAARKRLGEASSLHKNLLAKEAELMAREASLGSIRPSATAIAQGAGTKNGTEPTAAEFNSAESMGHGLENPWHEKSINPDQLADYVMFRQDVRAEKLKLKAEQPHIMADPQLSQWHADVVMRARDEVPGLAAGAYFDHATQTVNQWLKGLTAPIQQAAATEARLEKKAAAAKFQAPSGIRRKVHSGTDTPPAPTYRDKIQQMRESRGL